MAAADDWNLIKRTREAIAAQAQKQAATGKLNKSSFKFNTDYQRIKTSKIGK